MATNTAVTVGDRLPDATWGTSGTNDAGTGHGPDPLEWSTAALSSKSRHVVRRARQSEVRDNLEHRPGTHWSESFDDRDGSGRHLRDADVPEPSIRYRRPYNCSHTYETICVISGLNPAFIAQQLGHFVQRLLSTYARWINSTSDWGELDKLEIGIGPTQRLQVIDR